MVTRRPEAQTRRNHVVFLQNFGDELRRRLGAGIWTARVSANGAVRSSQSHRLPLRETVLEPTWNASRSRRQNLRSLPSSGCARDGFHGPHTSPQTLVSLTFRIQFCCAVRPTDTQRPSMDEVDVGALVGKQQASEEW